MERERKHYFYSAEVLLSTRKTQQNHDKQMILQSPVQKNINHKKTLVSLSKKFKPMDHENQNKVFSMDDQWLKASDSTSGSANKLKVKKGGKKHSKPIEKNETSLLRKQFSTVNPKTIVTKYQAGDL